MLEVATIEAPPDLSGLDLRVLWNEMKRRGFEALPAGAFEETVGKLEARVEAAEAVVLAAAERERNAVDCTDLMLDVSHIAGVVFPATVEQLGEAWEDNRELRKRAERSDQQVSFLARSIVEREFPETTKETDG